MKMKTMIARAYEIILEEAETVYDDFKEDDGTITADNHREATRIQTRMETWLNAAERVLGPSTPKKAKKKAPRGVVTKPPRKIVVVGKGSALE